MVKKNFQALCVKAHIARENAKSKVNTFVSDIEGSDTTEKIGMVVVAIVIVGLLATAVNAFMPNFFTQIFTTAKEKLDEVFNSGTYG